jgi:hypothetical protein
VLVNAAHLTAVPHLYRSDFMHSCRPFTFFPNTNTLLYLLPLPCFVPPTLAYMLYKRSRLDNSPYFCSLPLFSPLLILSTINNPVSRLLFPHTPEHSAKRPRLEESEAVRTPPHMNQAPSQGELCIVEHHNATTPPLSYLGA